MYDNKWLQFDARGAWEWWSAVKNNHRRLGGIPKTLINQRDLTEHMLSHSTETSWIMDVERTDEALRVKTKAQHDRWDARFTEHVDLGCTPFRSMRYKLRQKSEQRKDEERREKI